MITAKNLETVLKSIPGAYGKQAMSLEDLAKEANAALLTSPRTLTVKSAAAFLATMCQESGSLRYLEEIKKNGSYAPYIGRTFEQVTWNSNYALFGKWCVAKGLLDDPFYFTREPKKLADKKWAWLGGIWYWEYKHIWEYADDFLKTQKAVNLGNPNSKASPKGMDARNAWYKAWLKLGDALLPVIETPAPTPTPEPTTEPIPGTPPVYYPTPPEPSPPVVITPTPVPPVVVPTPTPKPTPAPLPIKHNKTYGDYVVWRGENFPPNTVKKLQSVPHYVGILQGGLSHAAPSANTHAGLGVGDESVRGFSKAEVWENCEELWEVNILPAPRGFVSDSFQGKSVSNINDGNEHIHWLDLDEVEHMHPEAKAQVKEMLAGGDGLRGNAHFTGPGKEFRTEWKDSMYNPKNVKLEGGVVYVQVESLKGLDKQRKQKKLRELNYKLTYVKQVYRWGRWNAVTESGTFYAIEEDGKTYLGKDPVVVNGTT